MITPENIETMKNWPEPKNVKELESFLGFMIYHRDHVKNKKQNKKHQNDLDIKIIIFQIFWLSSNPFI